MSLTLADLKAQTNVTSSSDDALLTRLLAVATKHVERVIGYALSDTVALPDGAPADMEHAVYMIAAHLYENREATLVGVVAQELPIGVPEILAEYRNYTFGLPDEVADDV